KVSYSIFSSSLVKVNPLPTLVLSGFHHLTSNFGLSPFQLIKFSSFAQPPWLLCNTTISSITSQSTRQLFSFIQNNLLPPYFALIAFSFNSSASFPTSSSFSLFLSFSYFLNSSWCSILLLFFSGQPAIVSSGKYLYTGSIHFRCNDSRFG